MVPVYESLMYLKISINRSSILQDAFEQLKKKEAQDNLLKIIKIHIEGEKAEDNGGVTTEFFFYFFKELIESGFFNIKNKVWLWPKKSQDLEKLTVVGLLLGFSIVLDCQIQANFPKVFFDLLLDELSWRKRKKVCLEDIKDVEPEIYTSLVNLKKDLGKF